MKIKSLDHLVLTVKDIESTCKFYSEILGMEVVEFKQGRKALTFGVQKINLHKKDKEFEPKASCPTVGSSDLCFVVDTELCEVEKHLKENNIELIEGPVSRTGAMGEIISVYFRDPDGNLLELSNYKNK